MNVPTKALIGLGVAGAVGGTSYAISTQFATENISKKLVDDGYQILDENDNDAEWTSILTSYLATVNTKDNLKFKDFDIKAQEVEKLKQACKKALNNPSTDNDSYTKAEYWCIVPKTVANLLNRERYRALDTSDKDENKDDEKWVAKLTDHASDKKEFKDKKFKDIPNIKSSTPAETKKENKNAIKNKCKELINKRHYQVDFKDSLEKSQIWCAIKENSQVSL